MCEGGELLERMLHRCRSPHLYLRTCSSVPTPCWPQLCSVGVQRGAVLGGGRHCGGPPGAQHRGLLPSAGRGAQGPQTRGGHTRILAYRHIGYSGRYSGAPPSAVAQNFLFKTRDEYSPIRAIDFGLSDFLKPGEQSLEPRGWKGRRSGRADLPPSLPPDQRLNDIVGSAYYIAPEVLHRSYASEADVWSVGVISYVLLCGSRPFWAETESGIFRSVLKLEPSFSDLPWPSLSPSAKEFVKGLLHKDLRRRPTAAQALSEGGRWGGGRRGGRPSS